MNCFLDWRIASAFGLAIAAGCGNGQARYDHPLPNGDASSNDGASETDAAFEDAASSACDESQATAPFGPRAAIEVARPGAGVGDVYLVDLSGPFPVCPARVTPESLPYGNSIVVEWSPDATMLAYAGGNAVQVVDARGPRPGAPVRVTPDGEVSCCTVSWSPDSRWVGFGAGLLGDLGDGYMSQVEDGVADAAIDVVPGMVNSIPAWHPGGRGMLVWELDSGSPLPLYWVPLTDAGPGVAELVTDQALSARWNPAGDRLVYEVMSGDRTDLFVADLNGDVLGDSRLVTTHSGSGHLYGEYDWSPDGRQLLYRVSGNSARLFAVDVTDVAPTARRVDDREVGPVSSLSLGWVSSDRIHYQGAANVVYVVDLVEGIPGPSQDPSGGLEAWTVAPDHRSLVAERVMDRQYMAPVWVSLEDRGPSPRQFDETVPNDGHGYWFTSDSQRIVFYVQLPTPSQEPRRYRYQSINPADPSAEPELLFETALESAVPRMGPGQTWLQWENVAGQPPVLYYGNLAAGAAVDVVLEPSPLDWAFQTAAFAPL